MPQRPGRSRFCTIQSSSLSTGHLATCGCKDCGKLFKQRDMKQACEKTAGERLQDIHHTCACYKKQEQLNEYVLKHVGCKGKLRQSSLPRWNDLIHLVDATIVAFWKLLHSNPVQQHCERLPLATSRVRSWHDPCRSYAQLSSMQLPLKEMLDLSESLTDAGHCQ